MLTESLFINMKIYCLITGSEILIYFGLRNNWVCQPWLMKNQLFSGCFSSLREWIEYDYSILLSDYNNFWICWLLYINIKSKSSLVRTHFIDSHRGWSRNFHGRKSSAKWVDSPIFQNLSWDKMSVHARIFAVINRKLTN